MTEKLKMNVNVESMPMVACKKCRGNFFKDVVVIKKISAIVSPTGKDEVLPIPVFICDKCGHPLDPRDVGVRANDKPEEVKTEEKTIITP